MSEEFKVGDIVRTSCPGADPKYHNVIAVITMISTPFNQTYPYVIDLFPDVSYSAEQLELTADFERAEAVAILGEDYFA